MATLVVIRYPDQETAEQARSAVGGSETDTIHGEQLAAISLDLEGRYHVHTSHSGFPTATGAIWGGFWGFLFGTLFLIPFAGWATGAGVGAWLGHMKEKTTNEAFENRRATTCNQALPRCSWWSTTRRRRSRQCRGYRGTVMKTTLSEEHVTQLQYGPGVPAPRGAPS